MNWYQSIGTTGKTPIEKAIGIVNKKARNILILARVTQFPSYHAPVSVQNQQEELSLETNPWTMVIKF